jgi:hypothetical protein
LPEFKNYPTGPGYDEWCEKNVPVYNKLIDDYKKVNDKFDEYHTTIQSAVDIRNVYMKNLPSLNASIINFNAVVTRVNDAYTQMMKYPDLMSSKTAYNSAKDYYTKQYSTIMNDVSMLEKQYKAFVDYINSDKFKNMLSELAASTLDLATRAKQILYQAGYIKYNLIKSIIDRFNKNLDDLEFKIHFATDIPKKYTTVNSLISGA